MSNNQPALTKTCLGCGLIKPLSAFLQISSDDGTLYGTICANCRQAGITAPKGQEWEDSSSSDTQHTIDTKSKVKSESDKRAKQQAAEDRYFDDRDKAESQVSKTTSKQQITQHGEKKHRDSYLKNRSFLDSNKPNTVSDSSVHGSEAQIREAGRFDFSAPFEGSRVSQIKHTGEHYQRFKTWLGKSSPIVQNAERNNPEQKKESQQPTGKDVEELIDKTWGPGSRKR